MKEATEEELGFGIKLADVRLDNPPAAALRRAQDQALARGATVHQASSIGRKVADYVFEQSHYPPNVYQRVLMQLSEEGVPDDEAMRQARAAAEKARNDTVRALAAERRQTQKMSPEAIEAPPKPVMPPMPQTPKEEEKRIPEPSGETPQALTQTLANMEVPEKPTGGEPGGKIAAIPDRGPAAESSSLLGMPRREPANTAIREGMPLVPKPEASALAPGAVVPEAKIADMPATAPTAELPAAQEEREPTVIKTPKPTDPGGDLFGRIPPDSSKGPSSAFGDMGRHFLGGFIGGAIRSGKIPGLGSFRGLGGITESLIRGQPIGGGKGSQGPQGQRGRAGGGVLGAFADILGGATGGAAEALSTGGTGGGGSDSQAALLQAIAKLTEAVDKLNETMKGQKQAPQGGPQADGSFIPTLGKQASNAAATAAVNAASGAAGGTIAGSGSGDMTATVAAAIGRALAMAAMAAV